MKTNHRVALQLVIVLAALAIAAAWIFYGKFVPQLQHASTLTLTRDIHAGIEVFREDYGELPTTDPVQMISALRGLNAEGLDYLPDLRPEMVKDGMVVDTYGTPLAIDISDPLAPTVTSLGPDRTAGTPDDVPHTEWAKIFDKYGGGKPKPGEEEEPSDPLGNPIVRPNAGG